MPTTPHLAAGMRSEPPMSEPVQSASMSQASATAEPPEEPPALSWGLKGLPVAPQTALRVLAPAPNSGCVGLGNDYGTGLTQEGDHSGVGFRHVIPVERRAVAGQQPLRIAQILDAGRQAVQCAELLAAQDRALRCLRLAGAPARSRWRQGRSRPDRWPRCGRSMLPAAPPERSPCSRCVGATRRRSRWQDRLAHPCSRLLDRPRPAP